jgi:hypothetical protein
VEDGWLPLACRDFRDVPRVFVVEHDGRSYLFECAYDVDRDVYADGYTIYRGGERSPGNVVGWLPVEAAEFDPTKRAAISAAVVDYLG